MLFDSRAIRLRIPQDDVRIRLDELITFTGLILWVLQAYIDDSGFGTLFGTELGKLIRYFCLLLFLVKIVVTDMHLAARAVSVAAVFFCYLMMIQQMAGAGITFLQLFVMMMAVKECPSYGYRPDHCEQADDVRIFPFSPVYFYQGYGIIQYK